MADVWQEMHCTMCKVYFGLHFDSDFTGVIGIRCGICKHPHTRYIKSGEIKEDGRYNHGKPTIEVEVLRSACYPTSRVQTMLAAQKKAYGGEVRDGKTATEKVVARELDDAEKARRQIIMDSWLNKYQYEQFG